MSGRTSGGLTDRSFTATRTFTAPVSLVFKLWTDPQFVAEWWGIEGATNPVCQIDARPGGKWRIDMRTASGKIYRNHGVYLEVVENERLVYSNIPDRELAEWEGHPPEPSTHTVTFEPLGARTKVSLEVRFSSQDDKDRMIRLGMRNGLEQGFDRLERLLGRISSNRW